MVSSLAEQLARGASLNANLLNEKSRRQAASESYLFSPREATQHDLDSLHALGLNGFLQLSSLQPDLARFEHALFSDSARNLDRTLQSAEQNARLDATIAAFLSLLGPFLLDAPTGKVLEWLVRRFRIHEFNVSSVVSVFLPYHETPHFTKMISILHIPDHSPLRFLQPYKTTTKPLHRAMLINDMLSHPEVARLVAEILPSVLKNHSLGVHRALIAFHAGVILEYTSKLKTLNENAILVLLPAAVEPLQSASSSDSLVKPALLHELILGSYLVLAAISQKTRLTSKALKSLLASVVDCAERVSPKQLVRTFVSLCAPQDQLEKMPSNVVKRILATSSIEVQLVDAMGWIGAEKFLCPLIDGLIVRTDDGTAQKILETVLISAELLPAVARSSASTILRRLTEQELSNEHATTMRVLISQLHQRHPKALREAAEALILEEEDKRAAVEQLVLSLSVHVSSVSGADAQVATLLVGSANAEATVRESAVRNLVKRLDEDSVSGSEVVSITTTLLHRVQDTSAAVLQALYTTSPEKVAQAFLTASPSPFAYLHSLKTALHSSAARPSREVIRAHLSFLLVHFLPLAASSSAPSADEQERKEDSEENRERSRRVLVDILLPFLLYSKPRMKTAQAVWEILEATEGSTAFELLGGCVDAVKWEQARPVKQDGDKEGMDIELLTKINIAVAAKIADNILASNYFKADFEALLEKLQDENPHGRAISYLVTRALLNRLSGEQRVDAGHRVLQAMSLETLEGMGDFMRGLDAVGNSLDDASVGSAVVLKPSSQNTLNRLQLAVLSVLPSFPRPPGASLVWIAEHSADPTSEVTATDNVRGARYIQLLRAVYRLSNSSVTLPLLSTYLLRSLFINLGDDALAFLAGVWLTSQDERESSTHIQYAALRHACAFLEAHVATQRTLDFQTVFPAILVMMQSTDATVREAAGRCIAAIATLSVSKEAEAIYAFDTVYGADSDHLQYLDWSDFQKYVKAIMEIIDHLVHDPDYLQAFHSDHLSQSKGEPRKLAGYKQRVLCYLVSHVNGCPLFNVKAGLLKSVEAVSNEAKVQVMQPTVEKLLAKGAVNLPHFQGLAASAASAFDASSAAELNNAEKSAWSLYENLFSTSFRDASWVRARNVLLHRLQHGLYAKLSVERKSQVCRMLLDIGAEDESMGTVCKKALVNLLDDVPLIVRLVVSLQPQAGPTQPAAKRPRVDNRAAPSTGEDLSSLSVLAEVISSLKIPSSLDLLSSLLETLHKVTSSINPDASDRRFLEQLLMSAIENVVENLPPMATVASGAIRVDTLVEILRTSENPQTFHQACLLMASLARVAPDAVLHNVMPIFTFMGSNVFHRDDTYSFRVVQKTIDSIVPVMVSSLKDAHTSGVELYQASREFLRVFTNAANHIPRHRRVNFFSHLVDTLGPADFLAPVAMLLVDRVSSRVVRQTPAESVGSLFLPLALHEHYAADVQLSSLVALAHEVQRLIHNDGSSASSFLEDPAADDEQTHVELAAKRRAAALLMFTDHALRRLRATALSHSDKERTFSKDLLVLLLAISTARPDDASYLEIASAARSAMASTLGVMSAPDFVSGVLTLLESGSVYAQAGALELLSERLTQVAEKARRSLTGSVVKILDTIRDILTTAQEASLSRPALQALTAISNTLAPGEENSIAATVPLLLRCLAHQALRNAASTTLLAFSSKLGPRAIPYLKDIVQTCVGGIRDAISASTDEAAFVAATANVLRNILSSIPTFWGETEILLVVELFLDSWRASAADTAEVSLLVKATAKRASPNVLLPALCSMWTRSLSTTPEKHKILAYIQVVKISVKAASRPAILENLRELFKTFLSVFEFCAELRDSEFEGHAIAAFVQLVVKLNETAFRPIFRKMFDWAFTQGTSVSGHRMIVFCHVYASLLEYFKALMVPYMSFAWQALSEQLRDCTTKQTDGRVWLAMLQTTSRSISADEDRVFWRHDKLRQFVPLAVQQVPVAISMNVAEGKTAVQECLISLLALIDDDTLAKTLNLNVLMHSRSEDSRVRLFSLTCAEQLWRAHGDKLLGFVAETATFIAEAAEDENDSVVQEAHRLKNAVESIGGTIDVS